MTLPAPSSADSLECLQQLGAGRPIADLCRHKGWSRAEFDAWFQSEQQSRRRPFATEAVRPGGGVVAIDRDQFGIPHLRAENEADLFFGWGYALAEDRLWQIDYLVRRGLGRLSEILGPGQLELDLTARTVDLPGIAAREWEGMSAAVRDLIAAYGDGINQYIREIHADDVPPPLEFDLLGYRPLPFTPQELLAIAVEFRWYLTGRFPVICIPELAKRALGGDGPLYRAFLEAEADAETILPAGSYTPRAGSIPGTPAALSGGAPDDGTGSNNWVLASRRTTTGGPLLASDPHIAFAAVSCWHNVRVSAPGYDAAGCSYVGIPAVMLGRNRHVAWGITNNICSLRDLYQEQTDPAQPGCFRFGDAWEPWRERRETIAVRGQSPVTVTVRSSRHGPIVDDILPAAARATGPVSLRWQGAEYCNWIGALQGINRARNVAEAQAATEGWLVPTFCLVLADDRGQIGYQCTGQIPQRSRWERGYRRGWDPGDVWTGRIPFAQMPRLNDPPQGFVATANNRVAPDDYPWPLFGTWASGHRALRIRQMIEAAPRHGVADVARMQQDSLSLRAVDCLPAVVEALRCDPPANTASPASPTSLEDRRVRRALQCLAHWDSRMETDRAGATLFSAFFQRWQRAVADVRFPPAEAALVASAVGGLATALLRENRAGWFADDAQRLAALRSTFAAAVAELRQSLGPEPEDWAWGRMHRIQQFHPLHGRGDLGALLDTGGHPVKGDLTTVCNSGLDPATGEAPTGAGFRMIADLADPSMPLYLVDAGSSSGHPGHPHYDDQFPVWQAGEYHVIRLDR